MTSKTNAKINSYYFLCCESWCWSNIFILVWENFVGFYSILSNEIDI